MEYRNPVREADVDGLTNDFGVCTNASDRCGWSIFGHEIDNLIERLRVIVARRERGGNIDELIPALSVFVRFYQQGEFCTDCNGVLVRITQPTVGLDPGSEEYRLRKRSNEALQAGYGLQSLGVLLA